MRWALASVVLAATSAVGEEPWRAVSDEHGVRVEVQAVAGTGFENVRVTCSSAASPKAFMKSLWGVASDHSASPEVIRRTVLLDEAQARRYHDVIRAPPATDRDYVMHQVWSEDAATGAVTARFWSVDDPRAPVSPELVRFGTSRGTVSAAPADAGGSTLTYVVFTDLGGALPAWLARGPQREAARRFLLEIRRRAEAPGAPD